MFYKYSCSCTIAVFISLVSKNTIMITNVTQKAQRQYIFFDFKNILPFNNCFLLFSPFPSLHSPFERNPHYPRHSSFLPFSVITFPLIEVASDSWVCAPQKRSMCKGGGLSPFSSLSSFGGSGAYRINDSLHSPFEGGQGDVIFQCLWPKAQCLFLFFRLETPFLLFFVSLYYTMSQSLIYPFYTNRPRFV